VDAPSAAKSELSSIFFALNWGRPAAMIASVCGVTPLVTVAGSGVATAFAASGEFSCADAVDDAINPASAQAATRQRIFFEDMAKRMVACCWFRALLGGY
jgi:hypothetical protein